MLISCLLPVGWLTAAERHESSAGAHGSWLSKAIRRAALTPAVITVLYRISQTSLGGRLLFDLLVKPLTQRSLQVDLQSCSGMLIVT